MKENDAPVASQPKEPAFGWPRLGATQLDWTSHHERQQGVPELAGKAAEMQPVVT